jgi:hypothetical protein
MLTPRLGEPFGGSTGLVDIGVGRYSHEQAIGRPVDGPSLPLVDSSIDADRTTLLGDHRKHDPVVDDNELFDFHAKLGEGAEPFVQEATNCRLAFVKKASPLPPVKDGIGSEEAHYRVDVRLIYSLKHPPREISRVGRRGLLVHRCGSMAPDDGDAYAASGTTRALARAEDQPRLRGRNHYDFPPAERPPWQWAIDGIYPG